MTSQFSKKANIILMALSIIGLIAGTALILFSSQLLPVILNFLEHALHRTISIDRWISTLQSFFIIPVFIVIFFNAIVFFKYDDKTKTILIISVLAIIAVMIVIANYVGTQRQMHSDIAAEMMLWRECVIEKSLMPRGWGYSTEIRILNTQIFGALFFAITNNWALVKTLVSVTYLIVLALATLFLLKQLAIEKLWIKLLCITFMVAPFSVETWEHIAFGNYYIIHLSISFCYVALALNLTNGTNKKNKRKSNQIYFIHCVSFFI